jgi:transcriptional regulator with XRE-family HTH domain
MTDARGASDLAGERVKEIRRRRGWTTAQLAAKLAEAGAGQLTDAALANIETGRRRNGQRRRDVTIDEILALAYVLNVPPVLLFTPVGTEDTLAITPTIGMTALEALPWVSGERPPPASATGEQRREWHATAQPVTAYRRLDSALDALEESGPEPHQINIDMIPFVADAINDIAASGLPVPALPPIVAEQVRRSGRLRHPVELPTTEEDGDGRR